jgi:GTP pyrophosphokinase
MAIAVWAVARDVWGHALGVALIVAGLKLDADSRLAALLFAVPALLEAWSGADIERDFGPASRNWSTGFPA